MIARLWHGATPPHKAEAYVEYLRRTGVTHCQRTPGNRGVMILESIRDDKAEFLFISFWESMDVVAAFAGTDIDRAVYYPEDREFLLEMEPTVSHYEVVEDERRTG